MPSDPSNTSIIVGGNDPDTVRFCLAVDASPRTRLVATVDSATAVSSLPAPAAYVLCDRAVAPATVQHLADTGAEVLTTAPRTWSSEQTRTVASAFAGAGTQLVVRRPHRFTPDVLTVDAALAANDFGPLVLVRIADLATSEDTSPTDIAWDAVESVDLASRWLDETPVGVYAQSPPGLPQPRYLCVTVHYRSGATAVCETGRSGAQPYREIYLQGSTASMSIPWAQPAAERPPPDALRELDAWLDDIGAGEHVAAAAPHALLRMRSLFDAIAESLTTGDVAIPETGIQVTG